MNFDHETHLGRKLGVLPFAPTLICCYALEQQTSINLMIAPHCAAAPGLLISSKAVSRLHRDQFEPTTDEILWNMDW